MPASHSTLSAHRGKQVQESDAVISGDAMLHFDNLGNRFESSYCAAGSMLAAIHRRHDKNRNFGQRGARPMHRLRQVLLVTRHLIIGSILALVCAVVQVKQIWLAMLQ